MFHFLAGEDTQVADKWQADDPKPERTDRRTEGRRSQEAASPAVRIDANSVDSPL